MPPDPNVKIVAMTLMAIMSFLTLGVCIIAVRKEQESSASSLWGVLAIGCGLGTMALWGAIAKLAGVTLG